MGAEVARSNRLVYRTSSKRVEDVMQTLGQMLDAVVKADGRLAASEATVVSVSETYRPQAPLEITIEWSKEPAEAVDTQVVNMVWRQDPTRVEA